LPGGKVLPAAACQASFPRLRPPAFRSQACTFIPAAAAHKEEMERLKALLQRFNDSAAL